MSCRTEWCRSTTLISGSSCQILLVCAKLKSRNLIPKLSIFSNKSRLLASAYLLLKDHVKSLGTLPMYLHAGTQCVHADKAVYLAGSSVDRLPLTANCCLGYGNSQEVGQCRPAGYVPSPFQQKEMPSCIVWYLAVLFSSQLRWVPCLGQIMLTVNIPPTDTDLLKDPIKMTSTSLPQTVLCFGVTIPQYTKINSSLQDQFLNSGTHQQGTSFLL